jgi:uncharacterized integral membrane protein
LRTLVWLLIGAPVALVIVALALVNNQSVTIVLDPFTPATPFLALSVPLYVVFFAALWVGALLGGVAVWANQHRFRRAARVNRREARRWQGEAERLKEEVHPTGPAGVPAGLGLPAPRRA